MHPNGARHSKYLSTVRAVHTWLNDQIIAKLGLGRPQHEVIGFTLMTLALCRTMDNVEHRRFHFVLCSCGSSRSSDN
jgi:hypothetical protein